MNVAQWPYAPKLRHRKLRLLRAIIHFFQGENACVSRFASSAKSGNRLVGLEIDSKAWPAICLS
jgi:hypothetical protein